MAIFIPQSFSRNLSNLYTDFPGYLQINQGLASDLFLTAEEKHFTGSSLIDQMASSYQPVSPIIPLSGNNQNRPVPVNFKLIQDKVGHFPTGIFHQDQPGKTQFFYGLTINFPHLSCS